MTDQEFLTEGQKELAELMRLLEIPGTAQPVEPAEEMMLSIQTEETGRVIGRKGQALEALELVLNRIMRKKNLEAENLPWIALDVDGYHITPHSDAPHGGSKEGGRRSFLPQEEEARLRAMALDIAREVKKLGKSRVIGPFLPAERRIIHVTLENDPEVETVSDAQSDEHRGKKITIRLKNAE